MGGLIGVIPNYFFARRLNQRRSAAASESLRGIYTGEFLKIAFTVALFVIAIRLLDVSFGLVVLAYLVTVFANWIALLFIDLGEQQAQPDSATRARAPTF